MATAVLYTPAVLALAVDLAAFPFDAAHAYSAAARSPTCGSQLQVSLACDASGRIDGVGMAVQACAIGQAASAIFAKAARGRNRTDVETARMAIAQWLKGEGPMPDWPGLDILSAVPDYPGRHGAVLLAWNAAIEALS